VRGSYGQRPRQGLRTIFDLLGKKMVFFDLKEWFTTFRGVYLFSTIQVVYRQFSTEKRSFRP